MFRTMKTCRSGRASCQGRLCNLGDQPVGLFGRSNSWILPWPESGFDSQTWPLLWLGQLFDRWVRIWKCWRFGARRTAWSVLRLAGRGPARTVLTSVPARWTLRVWREQVPGWRQVPSSECTCGCCRNWGERWAERFYLRPHFRCPEVRRRHFLRRRRTVSGKEPVVRDCRRRRESWSVRSWGSGFDRFWRTLHSRTLKEKDFDAELTRPYPWAAPSSSPRT